MVFTMNDLFLYFLQLEQNVEPISFGWISYLSRNMKHNKNSLVFLNLFLNLIFTVLRSTLRLLGFFKVQTPGEGNKTGAAVGEQYKEYPRNTGSRRFTNVTQDSGFGRAASPFVILLTRVSSLLKTHLSQSTI
jgi:hypothetical protein